MLIGTVDTHFAKEKTGFRVVWILLQDCLQYSFRFVTLMAGK